MTVSRSEKIVNVVGVKTLGLAAAIILVSLPAKAQMPVMSQAMPEPTETITPERDRAHSLFRNLTGTLIPIDDPRLKEMETYLKSGQDREAVKVATRDPLFIDIRVRDMARKMSVRDESVRAPLSDFVATFAGVVRDSDTTSAKELLTGNFTYRASATLATGVRQTVLADIINSNNHYLDITTRGYSLHAVLVRVDGQQYNANNVATALPDPAGLLTTRGWMEAHAIAGTNRRLVEYAFQEFMCQPMTMWADATAPDDRVARDVPRSPAGSNEKYLTTCKACHGQMDGLRGAFARVDYVNNRIAYTPNAVPAKMNRNDQEFPAGFVTTDASWVNYATVGKNSDAFGWRSATTGTGMAAFGAMLANSRGFSRCMAKRVFTEICKKGPSPIEETSVIRTLADQFESSGYHMKGLFEIVALRPECGINVSGI
jgi:hypothetical protein